MNLFLIKKLLKFFQKKTASVATPTKATDTSQSNGKSCVSHVVSARLAHPLPYTLGELQEIFAFLISHLILHIYKEGYQVRLGQAYRTPEEAKRMQKLGKGIENSLHTKKLAIDLNLFKDGKFLTTTKAHKPIGMIWEAFSTPGIKCKWGGRFSKPDGNHYSIEYKGIS